MSPEQSFPKPNNDPLNLGPEVQLDTTELSRNGVLILNEDTKLPKEAAEKWAISGDVLGVIELPEYPDISGKGMKPRGTEGFQIAVVDYGDDFAEKFLNDEAPGLGRPRARYNLIPLNYSDPMSGPGANAPIDPDKPNLVGRYGGYKEGINSLAAALQLDVDGENPALGSVSREHLTVTVTNNGIEIKDHSTNGTKVYKAPENADRNFDNDVPQESKVIELDGRVEEIGGSALRGALIDRVPKSAEEAQELIDAKKLDETNSQQEALKVQEAALEERMKAIKDNLSEEDGLNLWRYASGMLNKSQAQRDDNGRASIDYGQAAGQAYRELSPDAQPYADEYMRLVHDLEVVRNQQL